MDTLRLYRINRAIRHAVIDFLGTLPWETVVENRESSYHSLRNTLLHCVECEDWWLHYVPTGRQKGWLDWDAPKRHPQPYGWVDSMVKLREVIFELEARTDELLPKITPAELARVVDTGKRKMTVDEMFLHAITHEFHHRGEMLAVLWQRDVEPPGVDLSLFLGVG